MSMAKKARSVAGCAKPTSLSLAKDFLRSSLIGRNRCSARKCFKQCVVQPFILSFIHHSLGHGERGSPARDRHQSQGKTMTMALLRSMCLHYSAVRPYLHDGQPNSPSFTGCARGQLAGRSVAILSSRALQPRPRPRAGQRCCSYLFFASLKLLTAQQYYISFSF